MSSRNIQNSKNRNQQLKILSALPNGKLGSWIISNKIEFYITESNKSNYNVAIETLSPEDELIKSQNINNLLEKIKKLKPTYEKIIKMKYFQEMTYKDISHKTQIPLNTIKVMILRSKKNLAELISNENSKS